jgi:hypothetical protein
MTLTLLEGMCHACEGSRRRRLRSFARSRRLRKDYRNERAFGGLNIDPLGALALAMRLDRFPDLVILKGILDPLIRPICPGAALSMLPVAFSQRVAVTFLWLPQRSGPVENAFHASRVELLQIELGS